MKEQHKQIPLNELSLWFGIGRSKCHEILSYNITKIHRIDLFDAEYQLEGCVSALRCL